MNHWMFSCQEVSQKISQSMDVPLPFHHRMAIRIHLWMCRYCVRFRRQLMLLRKMSRYEDRDQSFIETTEKLSKETKARMKKKLHSFA